MFTNLDSETLWLTITNAALGIVTVVCIIAVGAMALKEWYADVKDTVKVPVLQDDHSFYLGDLGITMADGGKRIDEKENAKKYRLDDQEPNITRGEN